MIGTGGGIKLGAPSGGGGGGGGSIPDSSHLYSLLRRGVNQTSHSSGGNTFIDSWNDARGSGLGHPLYLPQRIFEYGGAAYTLLETDGSARYSQASGLRATTDDSSNQLTSVTDGEWTIYARIKSEETWWGDGGFDNTPFALWESVGIGYKGSDAGDYIFARSRRYQISSPGKIYYEIKDYQQTGEIEAFNQSGSDYYTIVLRGSPASGWSMRKDDNGGAGSFGSSSAYTPNTGGSSVGLSIGSAIHIGDLGSEAGQFRTSDFAIYKSYHSDAIASQVISYLNSAP